MYGINELGIQLYGDMTHGANQLILFNYRYRILDALKQNLEAIKTGSSFKVNISEVIFGDDSTELRDRQIVISSARDIAVVEYQGTTINRNSYLIRSQTKLRNFYVTFRLYVKAKRNHLYSNSCIELHENYIDEIIKGLYGYNPGAGHLKDLLLTGIQNDFGLVAYEVTETKPYSLMGDLTVKFEILFQYKEKYF